MKVKNLIRTMMIVAPLVFVTGCSDYLDEDYGYDDSDNEDCDDHDGDGRDSQDKKESASNSKYPIGTAGELEGTTLIVSIFTSDNRCNWDFDHEEDIENYNQVYNNLQIGTDWICEVGKEYKKSCEFIYDWNENQDLYYEAQLDVDDVTYAVDNDGDNLDLMAFEYIDSNIDVEGLKEKYDADNVVFLMLFNTSPDNEVTSCTRNHYEGMPYPYEICYMFMQCENEKTCPATFAHEILHTFGAKDLYAADEGITQEYVDYAADENTNDIMRTTFDVDTDEAHYNKVTNEITDITAYYIGWSDSSDTVDEWGLGRTEH